MSEIFCIVKFGKHEHMESLLKHGRIRFSPVSGFTKAVHAERNDKFEGAFEIINDEVIDIQYDHPDIGKGHLRPVPGNLSSLVMANAEPYGIFCAYALTFELFEDRNFHTIDRRMLEFDKFALMINDPDKFKERVFRKLSELGVQYKSGLVEYKELHKRGTIEADFFTKTSELSHQNEFRILIGTKDENPFYIEIGSLEDIAFFSTAEDMLSTEFKVSLRTTNRGS